jgi:hypothetical protein
MAVKSERVSDSIIRGHRVEVRGGVPANDPCEASAPVSSGLGASAEGGAEGGNSISESPAHGLDGGRH